VYLTFKGVVYNFYSRRPINKLYIYRKMTGGKMNFLKPKGYGPPPPPSTSAHGS